MIKHKTNKQYNRFQYFECFGAGLKRKNQNWLLAEEKKTNNRNKIKNAVYQK